MLVKYEIYLDYSLEEDLLHGCSSSPEATEPQGICICCNIFKQFFKLGRLLKRQQIRQLGTDVALDHSTRNMARDQARDFIYVTGCGFDDHQVVPGTCRNGW